MRKKLSNKSIGSWRKYADTLMKPIIIKLRKALNKVDKKHLFPFRESMNWDLSEEYPYPTAYSKQPNMRTVVSAHGESSAVSASPMSSKMTRTSSSTDTSTCYCVDEPLNWHSGSLSPYTYNIIDHVVYKYDEYSNVISRN